MKVEVDVLGSPSLIVLNMVSVDVKQHGNLLRAYTPSAHFAFVVVVVL